MRTKFINPYPYPRLFKSSSHSREGGGKKAKKKGIVLRLRWHFMNRNQETN